MTSAWHDVLRQFGARVDAERVVDFGDPPAERLAAATASVLADLSPFSVLDISGADAPSFLQGQLTCDVTAIVPERASLGAYCSPKGRMLADFFLAQAGDDRFFMVLPRELAEPIRRRLQMFVLRSKVQIVDATPSLVLLGMSGPDARAALESLHPVWRLVMEMPGRRFIAGIAAQEAPAAWKSLAALLRPVGTPCWEWLDIRNGIPIILKATQDTLVPQMANLELLGGVSFDKGCYTGQEVVARSQHLGRVKRRMFLAKLSGDAAPQAGDELYSDDLGNQASGLVVNAQLSPASGYDLLAVAQVASKEHSVVRHKSPSGPALQFMPMPYELR